MKIAGAEISRYYAFQLFMKSFILCLI